MILWERRKEIVKNESVPLEDEETIEHITKELTDEISDKVYEKI